MSQYIIYTDSACDIDMHILQEWGVYSSCLSFHFEGDETQYTNSQMPISEFYSRMHSGLVAKTSAVNVATFLDEFEMLLKQGLDILYIGFASSLSATYNSAAMAAEQLREQYPERKIITIDTLCVSAGQALVLYETVNKKNEGATIEEAAAHAQEISDHVCQWITVEDLKYLKRGGRISPTTALVGKAMGIKPLIFINAQGKLENLGKARGIKKAVQELVNYYADTAADPSGMVFVSHSEYEEIVCLLEKLLKEHCSATVKLVTSIGPVVGAHIGPGGLFFSYVGKNR